MLSGFSGTGTILSDWAGQPLAGSPEDILVGSNARIYVYVSNGAANHGSGTETLQDQIYLD